MTALGIDVGTSGARAALLGDAGETVAFARAPIAVAERDSPAAWWSAVRDALGRMPLQTVGSLAVAGTSGTLVPLDEAGEPVGRASLYDEPVPALARIPSLLRRPGAVRVAHQADWITAQFTGLFGITDENNALKSGYDPALRCWCGSAGADKRPRVVPPGTPIGQVLPVVAAALGLPSGVIVHAGTTDGCASVLAAGAAAPGDAVTSLGSTLTLKVVSERPITDTAHGIYSHRLGAHWLAGGASNSGGAVLAQFFAPEEIAHLSARIDPGSDSKLDYYPLPRPGERFPVASPDLPPRLTPRPAEDGLFLHGMLEGIARIEARGYGLLAGFGAPARCVRTVGGGAANPTWTAIRARILNLKLTPADALEAAVGAARLGALPA